jgi:hypothetical protein
MKTKSHVAEHLLFKEKERNYSQTKDDNEYSCPGA